MSLRASRGWPEACSGDMYAMVPMTTPGRVSPAVIVCAAAAGVARASSFASPKSASFA